MGTAEATLRMDSMEVKDEWQDEDFPRYPYMCMKQRVSVSVQFVYLFTAAAMMGSQSRVLTAKRQQVCSFRDVVVM